jgi:hypothetical protein
MGARLRNKSAYALTEKQRNFVRKKLFLINKIKTNLGAIFINNFKLNTPHKHNTSKCNSPKCKICPIVCLNSFIKLKNFNLPIIASCNCNSSKLIYIIEQLFHLKKIFNLCLLKNQIRFVKVASISFFNF